MEHVPSMIINVQTCLVHIFGPSLCISTEVILSRIIISKEVWIQINIWMADNDDDNDDDDDDDNDDDDNDDVMLDIIEVDKGKLLLLLLLRLPWPYRKIMVDVSIYVRI